jgi:nucleotide-binding universal stress UspA family protein
MNDRIVVPLDGSQLAESILVRIRPLLRREGSEIVLVRAVELPPAGEADAGRIAALLAEDAQHYVKAMEKRLGDIGLRARSVIRVGGAAGVILDAAAEVKATMIAMTTHGRSGLARWFLGSVAEKVLRASDVPVLLLRSFQGGLQGTGQPAPVVEEAFDRILVPIDGSRSSLAILPEAISIAKRLGSRVFLVSVEEQGFHVGGFSGKLVDRPATRPELPKEPTAEDLARFAEQSFAAEGIPTTSFALAGNPAVRLLDFAREQKATLIAMSTHGRSGPSRWVLGSVTEKVLRAADVPMLIVRSGKA